MAFKPTKKQLEEIIKKLILAIFVLFPLGQLTRLPFNIPFVNIYLHDLLIFLVVVFWLIKTLKYKKIVPLTRTQKWLVAFTIAAAFSLLINIKQWGIDKSVLGSLYLVRWTLYLGLFLATRDLMVNKRVTKTKITKMLILAGFTSAMLGLGQYFFYPDFFRLSFFGWDPHWDRVAGTFFDPGFSGMIYLLSLILIFTTFKTRKIFSSKYLLAITIVIYLAFALTYARSAYVAFLVATAVYSILVKSRRFFLTAGLILILTLIALPKRASIGTQLDRRDTIWARIQSWENSLTISSKFFPLGTGFNNYRWAQEKEGLVKQQNLASHSAPGTDSSILFVFATTGLAGLVAYLGFIKRSLKTSSLAVVVTAASLLAHSLFNNSLFYPWIMMWWWLVLAKEEN